MVITLEITGWCILGVSRDCRADKVRKNNTCFNRICLCTVVLI